MLYELCVLPSIFCRQEFAGNPHVVRCGSDVKGRNISDVFGIDIEVGLKSTSSKVMLGLSARAIISLS